MKKYLSIVFAALFVFVFTGCGAVSAVKQQVVDKVVTHVDEDLTQVSQIAAIADKQDVKQCSDWLQVTVGSLKSNTELADKLDAIDTSGNLMASAFKDYLIAEASRNAGQGLMEEVKKNFASKCGQVQTQLTINFLRKAAKVGAASRGNVGALLTP